MYEIEMKAHLADPVRVQSDLNEEALFVENFNKDDLYFSNDKHLFRLRTLDETPVRWIVTIKDKNLKEGIEVNKEVEFEVSSPSQFREFAAMLGYSELIQKTKRGSLYRMGQYHIELCEIFGLGHFLEIEYLSEQEVVVEDIRKEIMVLMNRFGLGEAEIESRYYIEMLLEKKRST